MATFSMAFIFEGSQKEITIDGDGDVFNNAVFNILTPIVTLVMAFMGITIADKEGKRFFGQL